jgi:NAD(P)-dependent dehydrogenase (short-subunit alcohol dehydrogenase family)
MATRLHLSGRTALITGGTGGIGAAVAARLSDRGTNIVLTDVNADRLDRVAATLPPATVLAMAADVTDASAMRNIVGAAVDQFGGLDVVFANAGIMPDPPSTLRTMDPHTFERVVAVDLLGVWHTIQPALDHVIDNQGHILINASIYAFTNGAITAPYAASKAALEQLGRALRAELRPHGATAGVLYPGLVATDIQRPYFGGDPVATELRRYGFKGPLGRLISADRLAAAVVPGIERRDARIIFPRRWIAFSVLRGIVNPVIDARLDRDQTFVRLLNQLETERQGTHPPARITEQASRPPTPRHLSQT